MTKLEYKGHQDQRYGHITYAQHGDDLMIANIFTLLGIAQPTYLDIGAHHPTTISNTALLYARGSKGVNIEANPLLISEFKKLRPLDTTVNIGVAVENGTKVFHMWGDTSGRNTFSEDEVRSLSDKHKIYRTMNLPVLTIDEIILRFCRGTYPDLLTMDIEGLDYDVLKSANFSKSCPKIIVTETRLHCSEPVKRLLEDREYFCYCRMGENLFFIHNAYRPLVY